MPILGMGLPLLVIIDLCLFIICLFKNKKFAVLLFIALLFNISYFKAILQINNPQAKPSQDSLTIATYNVAGFGSEIRGYSCKRMAEYMEKAHVDVICMQEFNGNEDFPIDSIQNVLCNWPYFYITPKEEMKGHLPLAVFSKYPLQDMHYIAFPKSVNGSIWGDIEMGERTVRLFSCHLQTTSINQNRRHWADGIASSDKRRNLEAVKAATGTLHSNLLKRAYQADSIYNLIISSPNPVVLCGDFNSLPSSYTYYRFNKILTDGFKSAGNGYMSTFRYGKNLARIDYIFHSPTFTGLDYYSPRLKLSTDHYPVIMTLGINF